MQSLWQTIPSRRTFTRRRPLNQYPTDPNFLVLLNWKIHIRLRSSGYILRIQWTWTHILGKTETDKYTNRQQVSHTIFPNKLTSPTLWNARDYVIQFNLTIAHFPVKNNTAADFLWRLEIIRIRQDITTTPIELHVQSAGVMVEEQTFHVNDHENETDEQTWQQKKEARSNPTNQTPKTALDNFNAKKHHQKVSTFQKLSSNKPMAIE